MNLNECTTKERKTVSCPQNGLSKYASETSVFRCSLCCTDDDEDLVLILNISITFNHQPRPFFTAFGFFQLSHC